MNVGEVFPRTLDELTGDDARPAATLGRLQHWMLAVVTHPDGLRAGLASRDARRALDLSAETLEQVVAPSATLTGAERLAVYGRSYHARLLECFRAVFPCLRHALGAPLFDDFALDYLSRHPPRSYTLDRLADYFPQHLADTRPDADAPPGERESWPDFVVELAALELQFMKVYDGPGLEGRPAPDADELAALSDRQLLGARPAPAPCLRLFTLTHPAHLYLLAARRGESPAPPPPAPCFVAMTRRDYRVRLHELTRAEHSLLELLDGRRTVGQALELSARRAEAPPPAAVRILLRGWTAGAFFERVER